MVKPRCAERHRAVSRSVHGRLLRIDRSARPTPSRHPLVSTFIAQNRITISRLFCIGALIALLLANKMLAGTG
jgi:hypothetical protein